MSPQNLGDPPITSFMWSVHQFLKLKFTMEWSHSYLHLFPRLGEKESGEGTFCYIVRKIGATPNPDPA